MSKLIPTEKGDESKSLLDTFVGYVMDAKPYHVKLRDVVVELIYQESLDVLIDDGLPYDYGAGGIPSQDKTPGIRETMFVYMTDKMVETIDMLFDYHVYSYRGFGVARLGTTRYDANQFDTLYTDSYGFNLYGYGMDHYGAVPKIESAVDNTPTTIYTGITEHLVIDATRRIKSGFDSSPYDAYKFDTNIFNNSLAVKSFDPIECCSCETTVCGDDPKQIKAFDGDNFDRLLVNSPLMTPCPSPSPSPSPTPSPTPTSTPTPSPTKSPIPTPSPSASKIPAPTPSPSASKIPAPTPSPSASKVPGVTPSPAPSGSPKPTPTPSKTPAATSTPKPTPSPTKSPIPTPSPSKTPNPTPSPSSSALGYKKVVLGGYQFAVMDPIVGEDIRYTWSEAMAYAQKKNSERYLGYTDWKVPGIMESWVMYENRSNINLTDGTYWTSETNNNNNGQNAYGLNSRPLISYKSDTQQHIMQALFGSYVQETNKFKVRLIRGN